MRTIKSSYMKKVLFVFFLLASSFLNVTYGQNINYREFGIDVAGGIPQGLKEGETAPDFFGYDQTGKQVELKKMLEKGPVILFFYRGKWDSVCSRYLNNYQDSLKVLTDLGFSMVAITPESIENVEQTIKLHNITFTVVYDCQEKIMKDYNVMFSVTKEYQDKIKSGLSISIAENNGRDEARLPVPATFIISRDGIIVATQFNPDFNKRASVKWMLANLGHAL